MEEELRISQAVIYIADSMYYMARNQGLNIRLGEVMMPKVQAKDIDVDEVVEDIIKRGGVTLRRKEEESDE